MLVLETYFNALWTIRVKDKEPNQRKLSTYKRFKDRIEYENYIDVIKDVKKQKMMSRFRISNHQLAIERGRYTKVPRENRVCPFGCAGEIEDEEHFLMACKIYKNERAQCGR